MPFAPFTPVPPDSNTPPRLMEDPRGHHRGGISTFMFIIVLAVLACVIYTVTMHQGGVAQQERVEETVRASELKLSRPPRVTEAEALSLAHHVDVYKFTGTNNDGQFTVDPGKAVCDTHVWDSQDSDEYGVVACDIPVDPTTNPLNESSVLLNITIDWTNANTPVRCDFYLGESTHIGEVAC